MGETIQHFIDSGDQFEAWCHSCRHHQVLDMVKLRDRLGPDHGALHDEIAHKLRCSKCGGKKIGLLRHAKGNDSRNMAGAHNLSRMIKPKEAVSGKAANRDGETQTDQPSNGRTIA